MALGVHTECTKLWKLDNLALIVDSVESYIVDAVRAQHIKTGNDYLNILLYTFGKSITTMREIICLSTFGFPDGALSLARNIYEEFIVVSFFEKHRQDSDFQNYVDDYYLDYNIQRNKALRYEAAHFDNSATLKEIENETTKAISASHRTITKQDFWWTGKGTFANVVEYIQNSETDPTIKTFLARLHFAYKRACASIHASCLGNILRLGVDSNYIGIDNSPKTSGHELPLYLATCAFIFIVSITCKELRLDDKYMNKELNDLAAFYFKALNGGEIIDT